MDGLTLTMSEEVHVWERLKILKHKAAKRYKIDEKKCHLGHLLLEGLLDNPDEISQIDSATDERETFKSVAIRSAKLASAMKHFGLKVGDCVVIMGHNNLHVVIPLYACNYNGYPICAIDPNTDSRELVVLFNCLQPKIAFCPKAKENNVKEAFMKNNLRENIVFLDETYNIEDFIKTNQGAESGFRPSDFDPSNTTALYVLTSGTTGDPKVAIITFDALLDSVGCWWEKFTANFKIVMTIARIQWLSSLIFFVASPLRNYTRLQSSIVLTPPLLVDVINKYKPNVTMWTSHLLNQFLKISEDKCDLSSFKYIALGGSTIEKPLVDKLRERCRACIYLIYGMTELARPVFDFINGTPFSSSGIPLKKFQYRIVSNEGKILDRPFEKGELWIKGYGFFKGYLNNPEETQAVLTDDGWVKTGDVFYRDEQDFYYFVERKRLLIKYTELWVSPVQLETVIKQHPGVSDVCVVGVPDPDVREMPVAAIVKKNDNIDPQEIFDLIRDAVPEIRRLHGGFFYIDALPETPSGKVNRAKIQSIALETPRITPRSF